MIGEFELAAKGQPGPIWSIIYAEQLRVFLRDTEAGRQLRAMIEHNRPAVNATSVEGAALEGKFLAGYNHLAALISTLSYPVDTEPTDTAKGYPDLDDETQWEGAKPVA
jgi:hypothetical protein